MPYKTGAVRVRHELDRARRASLMISDPASVDTLRGYIFELEEELFRYERGFMLAASTKL